MHVENSSASADQPLNTSAPGSSAISPPTARAGVLPTRDVRDGKRFGIPPHRRLTWDLLHFNHHVPLCGHDYRMDLATVRQARQNAAVRISWPAVFLKAFAIVAREIPELRQTWHRWPWAHLYQHADSCAALTVQREFRQAAWLFWGLIEQPDQMGLPTLQEAIDRFCTESPRTVFRRQYQLARLPTPLRRLIWWWNLNIATTGRARRLGTFFLSTLSGRGVEIQVPPSIHTGCLTFGPLDERGHCRVTLAYDHRVMDGMRVAEILERLHTVLNGQMVEELQCLKARECSAKDAVRKAS